MYIAYVTDKLKCNLLVAHDMTHVGTVQIFVAAESLNKITLHHLLALTS